MKGVLTRSPKKILEWRLELLYFASRLLPMVLGLLASLLCTMYLSEGEQGVFFLLLSFVAAQTIFEGGMYYQLQQKLALLIEEHGHLEILAGDSQIAAFWYKSVSFLVFMACLYFLLMYAAANHLLDTAADVAFVDLALFLAIISVRFTVSGVEAMLEGAGHRGYVVKTRILTSTINGSILCIALVNAGGLASLIFSYGISLGAAILVHSVNHGATLLRLVAQGTQHHDRFLWRKVMFPVQMRLSVSWIFGYMTHQSLVPIIFYLAGPVSAGQFGFLMSIVNAVKNLSATFIAKESPVFGTFIGRHQYTKLRAVLKSVIIKTMFLLTILIIGCFIGLWLLSFFNSEIYSRIPDLIAVAIMLLAVYVMQLNLILASFVRAHNEEPFTGIAVVGGIVMASSIGLASYLSGSDIAIASAILVVWIVLGIYLPYLVAKPYLQLLRPR